MSLKESSSAKSSGKETSKTTTTDKDAVLNDAVVSNSSTTNIASSPLSLVLHSLAIMALLQILYRMATEAYQIRLYAIREYGRVIHEFDPYFNYRATEYLWAHGWKNFSQWFDYKVWYPLGRPVGTTIYPGMQVTTCLIKQYILKDWSINDICVFVPTWFGVLATLSVAWLTWNCVSGNEFTSIFQNVPLVRDVHTLVVVPMVRLVLNLLLRVTGSDWGLAPLPRNNNATPILTCLACAVAAASIMSIVPAHLLRSVGGGYDNESVAMTAMVVTFACWTQSLKGYSHLWLNAFWGIITGLAYFNMVAAWGGYVFVLNLIGLHAGALVLLGRYSRKLYITYTCFYIVGTALAIQVPVVGWTPLKSLEQMGPLVGFLGLQLIELSEVLIRQKQKQQPQQRRLTNLQIWNIRLTVFLSAGAVAAAIVMLLLPTGYFGPISSRVRGLFVKHTKTGNPLVDSVAEHQAASPEAYFQYLHNVVYLAPVGFAMVALFFVSDSSSFLLVYGAAAYYFSHRMVRLILLTAPIASTLGGIVLGRAFAWMFRSLAGEPLDLQNLMGAGPTSSTTTSTDGATATSETGKKSKKSNGKTGGKKKTESSSSVAPVVPPKSDPLWVKAVRLILSAYAVYSFLPHAKTFWDLSHQMMEQISHPSIIQQGRMQDGTFVRIDDYREAYWWLRDNTPEDSRVMAWWDYGYQITGISERTTIADGNTWNHEHIAFLGRTLTAPEKEAHRIARHLADYVLVWAGGGGDDLAKSPHLRRIANSVYRGLCSEPTCREFGFHADRTPTPSMEESLLYKLVMNRIQPDVTLDSNRFKEVYRSKYGKVRIYKVLSVSQESKDWVADPKNRVCDSPGSWMCRGQYPPALEKILKEKKDFKQLEDFNRKGIEDDEEYQRQYLENLMNPGGHAAAASPRSQKRKAKAKPEKLSKEDIEIINDEWEDNEKTTLLWQLISQGHIEQLKELISQVPAAAHIRTVTIRRNQS